MTQEFTDENNKDEHLHDPISCLGYFFEPSYMRGLTEGILRLRYYELVGAYHGLKFRIEGLED